jgi:hypothetical protein
LSSHRTPESTSVGRGYAEISTVYRGWLAQLPAYVAARCSSPPRCSRRRR